MNQGDIFLGGEADAYTKRNAAHNAEYDIEKDVVAQCIEAAGLDPNDIADFGCSTGERLEALCEKYRTDGIGADASQAAIDAARSRKHPQVRWYRRALPAVIVRPIDLIVTSFVWHWIARDDLTESLHNIDWQLVSGGNLVINDFYSTADVPYAHRPGVMTYKRLYPEMFIATGLYEEVYHRPHPYPGSNEACMCSVLRKK